MRIKVETWAIVPLICLTRFVEFRGEGQADTAQSASVDAEPP
jgi:hypothetical protein